MFKKILITIAAILIIAVIGLFIRALFISRQSGGGMTVTESFRDIISFGESATSSFPEREIGEFDVISPQTNDVFSGEDAKLPRLRQLADFPVAGATIIQNNEKETLIRFIASENGHIFEIPADSATQKRISNTTILRIQDAKWLSGGDAFIARFLDEDSEQIKSFYAEIRQSEIESEGTVDGVFLSNDIKELALSDKDKIFSLLQSGDGSVGIISEANGNKKVQIFNSPLSGWNIEWPSGDKIALTTKPSANILGYLYFLNTNTKKLEKILSGIRGLTTLVNKDMTYVLFTQNESRRLLLSMLDIENNEITDLPIWTLPEKCVWSELNKNIIYCGVPDTTPQGDIPDIWYQGLVSFSDSVWMIDIETKTADVISNPADAAGADIDIIKPILSIDENYLIFTNKKDYTLWGLEL